jgi:hypothetical protein
MSDVHDSGNAHDYNHYYRSGGSSSSGRWFHSHHPLTAARPNSLDMLQDGEVMGARPSTPDNMTFSLASARSAKMLADAGTIRRSLEHLDLTGNRRDMQQQQPLWLMVMIGM